MTPNDIRAIAIYGTGGFARELQWLATRAATQSQYEVACFVDDSTAVGASFMGLPVVNFEALVREATVDGVALGIGNPAVRAALYKKCEQAGFALPVLKDPSAHHADSVSIAAGCVICAGTVLTVDIALAEGVQINLNCTVGHDCEIGAYATLSPGVNVSGNVIIGERVFIGTGASIINGTSDEPLCIGNDSVIAAGACVTRDVDSGYLYAGVPATKKKAL